MTGQSVMTLEGFELAQRQARAFAGSVLVPDNLRGSFENCLVAMMLADEMGESRLAVMQNIYFVHGRAGWITAYMVGRANRSGKFKGPLRWKTSGTGEDLAVECFADLADIETDPRISITVDMKTAIDSGWTTYTKDGRRQTHARWATPRMAEQMLRWRSASWLIRLYAPETMMGLPTKEELDDISEREMVNVTPMPDPPKLSDFSPNGLDDEVPAESTASPPDRKEDPQHPHTQAGSPQDMQQHSGARQDRPQAGTPIPAGGATQRRRRRTKAEMEAARAPAIVIGPDGEIHEFDTASQAVELLTNLFTAARTFSALKALHEDNQDFIFALPDETLSALREIYTTKRQSELAADPSATTERPNGTDDAPEPDRQSPRVEEIPPTTRVQSAGAPPTNARISYAIEPVYTRTGQIDRAWWIALLIPKLRASKSKEELALRLADNGETIASYKQTLTPPALIAAMKQIDDIEREIAG